MAQEDSTASGDDGAPVAGGATTLDAILAAIETRNESNDRLIGVVTSLTTEVMALRAELDERPTAGSLQHKRRQIVATLLIYGMLIIWGHDEHIERCGPGHRLEYGVQVLLDGGERDEIIQAIRGADTPKYCDLTFPLHDHDGNGWPRPYNLVGMALYAVGTGGLLLWARGPKDRPARRDRRATDKTV